MAPGVIQMLLDGSLTLRFFLLHSWGGSWTRHAALSHLQVRWRTQHSPTAPPGSAGFDTSPCVFWQVLLGRLHIFPAFCSWAALVREAGGCVLFFFIWGFFGKHVAFGGEERTSRVFGN